MSQLLGTVVALTLLVLLLPSLAYVAQGALPALLGLLLLLGIARLALAPRKRR